MSFFFGSGKKFSGAHLTRLKFMDFLSAGRVLARPGDLKLIRFGAKVITYVVGSWVLCN